ncbi:MAG: DUF434 domain-containing protein [Planctomycetes bacterium]|nr:DUF434 domain-containing protein [Planctomycetota bacterium]
MPDKRRHRGKHPDDQRLFATSCHESLRTAVGEYSWLLSRGYAVDSALKLVGDRYQLTARQRMAVRRSACDDEAVTKRADSAMTLSQAIGQTLAIDGYNLLITIESALSGGLVLVGRDGCYRDIASVHGTYRKVEETIPAIELIVDFLAERGFPRIDWYLDKPVSNSGRLKVIITDVVTSRSPTGGPLPWNVAVVDSPDAILRECDNPIVTSDSAILDRCHTWINLAAEIIRTRVPDAWVVDLGSHEARG